MNNEMSKLACRNCGYELVEFEAAIAAVQLEYRYLREEFEESKATIQVWCPACAVADGRVDELSEVDDDFYWEVR